MTVDIICKKCRTVIKKDAFEEENADLQCAGCNRVVACKEGCYEFSEATHEKDFYEHKYDSRTAPKKELSFAELESDWNDWSVPERRMFLDTLPDLDGKTVLLLGNGSSVKELYFLKSNARIIYSDISLNAVMAVKRKYDFKDYGNNICFHAFDAYDIPLADASLDLVVGYAFVHHLDDLDRFLAEVNRVLKPGGRCHFLDPAYSPFFQRMKFSVLKPLMRYSHRKHGISPEDLRATTRGGYKQEEITALMTKHGFGELLYERFGFFYYFMKRGTRKLLPRNRYLHAFRKGAVRLLYAVDSGLSSISKTIHGNTLYVVWGFTKKRDVERSPRAELAEEPMTRVRASWR